MNLLINTPHFHRLIGKDGTVLFRFTVASNYPQYQWPQHEFYFLCMGLWVRFGLWTGSCLHVRFRGPPYVPHSQTQSEAAADTWTSTFMVNTGRERQTGNTQSSNLTSNWAKQVMRPSSESWSLVIRFDVVLGA